MNDAPARHTYTFENQSNSYFMGSDIRVVRDDGKAVKINGKDGMFAVNVKDPGVWTVPQDVREIANDLNSAMANTDRFTPEFEGQDFTDTLYDHARERFWNDAEWLANERGFSGVYSAGRSGGWCCIDGTRGDDAWEQVSNPQDEDDAEFRDNILELAFELVELIASTREHWADLIREEHAELEERREANIIRGTE